MIKKYNKILMILNLLKVYRSTIKIYRWINLIIIIIKVNIKIINILKYMNLKIITIFNYHQLLTSKIFWNKIKMKITRVNNLRIKIKIQLIILQKHFK